MGGCAVSERSPVFAEFEAFGAVRSKICRNDLPLFSGGEYRAEWEEVSMMMDLDRSISLSAVLSRRCQQETKWPVQEEKGEERRGWLCFSFLSRKGKQVEFAAG
jgi:hypothetical protein